MEKAGRSSPTRRTAGRPLLTAIVAVLITIGGVLGSIILAIPVGIVSVFAATNPSEAVWFVVAATAAAELGYLVVGYGYVRFRNRRIPLTGFSGTDTRVTLLGIVGALVVGVGLFALLAVIDLQPQTFYTNEGIDTSIFIATAAVIVLVAPPAEEYLFRGVIQGRLRDAFGPAGAITGASLLFGAIHLPNYLGSDPLAMIAGALVLTLVGAVFGYVYERTDNLLVPIAVHTGYNLVLMAVSAAAFI